MMMKDRGNAVTMLSTHLTNVRLVCPGEEDAELSVDERE